MLQAAMRTRSKAYPESLLDLLDDSEAGFRAKHDVIVDPVPLAPLQGALLSPSMPNQAGEPTLWPPSFPFLQKLKPWHQWLRLSLAAPTEPLRIKEIKHKHDDLHTERRNGRRVNLRSRVLYSACRPCTLLFSPQRKSHRVGDNPHTRTFVASCSSNCSPWMPKQLIECPSPRSCTYLVASKAISERCR